VVVGVFSNQAAAESAVSAMVEEGLPTVDIGVVRVEGARAKGSAVRRGLLTGALVGTATGVLLEGTVLAFPHAAIFIAGGTLAAALAGLAVGSSAGAVASALITLGLGATSARRFESALLRSRNRVLVTFSSRELTQRSRARLRMRVLGAIETHDAADDDTGPVFTPGFATVVPQLRAHLRAHEGSDRRWEHVENQYRYGWQMANRPDMEDRTWSEAGPDVRREWDHRHPHAGWNDVRRFVEAGWAAARADRAGENDAPRSGDAA
jgi:hypothetical protein